jgi:hypothetical protein
MLTGFVPPWPTAACIPSKANRKVPIPHDAALYRQRYRIEIMFGRLKDWRRIHTRYDRCAHTFMSRHLHRCHRHLLAQSMSPEPRLSETRGSRRFRRHSVFARMSARTRSATVGDAGL